MESMPDRIAGCCAIRENWKSYGFILGSGAAAVVSMTGFGSLETTSFLFPGSELFCFAFLFFQSGAAMSWGEMSGSQLLLTISS